MFRGGSGEEYRSRPAYYFFFLPLFTFVSVFLARAMSRSEQSRDIEDKIAIAHRDYHQLSQNETLFQSFRNSNSSREPILPFRYWVNPECIRIGVFRARA